MLYFSNPLILEDDQAGWFSGINELNANRLGFSNVIRPTDPIDWGNFDPAEVQDPSGRDVPGFDPNLPVVLPARRQSEPPVVIVPLPKTKASTSQPDNTSAMGSFYDLYDSIFGTKLGRRKNQANDNSSSGSTKDDVLVSDDSSLGKNVDPLTKNAFWALAIIGILVLVLLLRK